MSRCEDCVHDGCCDGLPHCGGVAFTSRWVKCERCGGVVDCDNGEDDEDGNFICFRCIDEITLERSGNDRETQTAIQAKAV